MKFINRYFFVWSLTRVVLLILLVLCSYGAGCFLGWKLVSGLNMLVLSYIFGYGLVVTSERRGGKDEMD